MKRTSDSWSRVAAMLVAAAGAFVLVQFVTVYHATEFGDHEHEHDGEVCALSLVAKVADDALGVDNVAIATAFVTFGVLALRSQSERARVIVRAARPRAPPHR